MYNLKTVEMNIRKYIYIAMAVIGMSAVYACDLKVDKNGGQNDDGKPAAESEKKGEPDAMKYADFKALDTNKAEHKLSEYVTPGKYALVDFWASWCGPCRAAIPHVRSINSTYKGKLSVVSVSLDSEEGDWRKALEQEKMEWTQLWAPAEMAETVSAAYGIQGIPFLVIIDGEGNVIYTGHNPMEVDEILAKVLKD